MKSLQNKYNLIKEGKGNKELFLKEAKTLFPNVVTNVLTYDQAIHNLKERGIISEGFIGISDQKTVEPNWFKIFKENVVDLKEGDINQAVAFYNKNQHLGTKAVAEKFGVEEADLMKALGQTPGGLFETGLKEGIDVEDLKPGEVYDYRGNITRGPNEGKPITGKLKFNKVDERNPNMFIFTWVEIESPDYDTRVGHSFYTSKQGLSKYLYKKDSITETVDVKASLKQTDKSVEDKETTGYDYKEKKNNNNISTAEILKGYYAEMKDPKNADKTEEELKKIVFKNLEKDPMYYVKSGEFGLKDVGYTEDAPGLGATKEVKGRYKSSGMEPVKLTESKSKIKAGDIIKHKLTGAKIKVKSIAGNNIEGTYVELGDMEGKVKKGDTIKTNVNLIGKTYELSEGKNEDDKIAKYEKYTYTLGGKKVKPDDIAFYNTLLGIEIDGEIYRPGTPDEKGNIELKPNRGKTGIYTESKQLSEGENRYFDTDPSDGDADFDMREMVRAEELYEKGLQAYSEGDLLKAQQYYKDALKAGSWLGWTEFDLPPYGNGINESLDETDITGIAGSEDEEDYKKGTRGVKKQKIKEYGETAGEVTFEYIFDEVEYEGEIYNIEATITAEIEDDDVSSSHPDDPTPTVQKTVAWKVDSLDSVERYNAATQEYIPATLSFDDKERLKKLVETSIEYKDMVVDKALDTYYNYEGLSEEVEEKAPKRQLMPNKQKGIADAIEVKSTLEKIAGKVWKEPDLKKAKEIVKQYLEDSKVNPASKKKMLDNTELIQSKTKLDIYIANALLKYEKLSVNEGILAEVLNNNIPDFLKDMIQDAIEDSKNGYVVHIEYTGAGRYRTSDWFDSDNTVYSVEDGRVLLDKTKEIDAEGNWKGAMNENLTSTDIKWNYPDVDNKDDMYYEPNPESKNYTVSLPITGVTSDGKTVKGTYTIDVPDMSAETLDDLDINPKYITIDEKTMREIRESKKTLSEAKKRAIEKHLKEIEKLSEIAAMDHKIQKLQEKIEELKNKITMTEGDDFVGMVDKNAVKEIKKDIAFLEKRKKIAEAQKAKLAKRVSGEGKPQTGTSGTTTTGMMETQPANLREMIKNVISSRKQKK